MTQVNDYFSGEKFQCTIGIILSVIFAGVAIYLILQLRTDLFRGVAYPFLIIPILLFLICAGVVWRTAHDIDRVNGYIQHEPEKIRTDEIPRMEKVMRSFKTIKIVEICLLVVGVAMAGYGSMKGNELLKGIGIGLAIQSAVMFGFDYFAHNRGKIYWDFLQSFK